jgi:hypothetical protein
MATASRSNPGGARSEQLRPFSRVAKGDRPRRRARFWPVKNVLFLLIFLTTMHTNGQYNHMAQSTHGANNWHIPVHRNAAIGWDWRHEWACCTGNPVAKRRRQQRSGAQTATHYLHRPLCPADPPEMQRPFAGTALIRAIYLSVLPPPPHPLPHCLRLPRRSQQQPRRGTRQCPRLEGQRHPAAGREKMAQREHASTGWGRQARLEGPR